MADMKGNITSMLTSVHWPSSIFALSFGIYLFRHVTNVPDEIPDYLDGIYALVRGTSEVNENAKMVRMICRVHRTF